MGYQRVSGTLSFVAGETTKTITVRVKGDRLGEADETFFVDLSNATGATIADGQGLGTIVDDEPRISISDVRAFEGNRGHKRHFTFTFTVTLSAAYDRAVSMSFRTVELKIMPMPRFRDMSALLPAPKRSTKNVSSGSCLLSPLTTTVMVFAVSPRLNVSVPVLAT